jgi:hypothetical protein
VTVFRFLFTGQCHGITVRLEPAVPKIAERINFLDLAAKFLSLIEDEIFDGFLDPISDSYTDTLANGPKSHHREVLVPVHSGKHCLVDAVAETSLISHSIGY